jgi:hypothetical protein
MINGISKVLLNCGDQVVRPVINQIQGDCFHHDPHHRLSPRGPHKDTALVTHGGSRSFDLVLQGLTLLPMTAAIAVFHVHILESLRIGLKTLIPQLCQT